MSEDDVTKLLLIIEESYPQRFTTTDDTISVWTGMLADMDYQDASRAVVALCRTNKFPPGISEIREAVAETVDTLPGVDDAYAEARDAASRRWTPPNGPIPHVSHPLIAQALKIIGVETMAMTDRPSVVAAQFRRTYENLRLSEIRKRQTGETFPMFDRDFLDRAKAYMLPASGGGQ